MSSFNGRQRPNVSDYIANLNTIPTAHEMASRENFNMEEDLAMFSNTQFFDFDLGNNHSAAGREAAEMQRAAAANNFDLETPTTTAAASGPPMPMSATADMKNMDFMNDFSFPDFSSFPPQTPYHADGLPPLPPTIPNHGVYPLPGSSASPPTQHLSIDKRKSEVVGSDASRAAMSFEEASRFAAEEDKRRRNTAASARFRIKKKQREAALERSAKEMSEKVAVLEGRINQLETENKWLKNLITEKNENKDDIASLWKKFNQESAERKGTERKDGVGTATKA